MTIRVSEKTRDIVCKSLNINCLAEIINRSYSGFSSTDDIDREKIALYSDCNRGSIRIITGRFYTAQEYDERVKRVTRMKLPY